METVVPSKRLKANPANHQADGELSEVDDAPDIQIEDLDDDEVIEVSETEIKKLSAEILNLSSALSSTRGNGGSESDLYHHVHDEFTQDATEAAKVPFFYYYIVLIS